MHLLTQEYILKTYQYINEVHIKQLFSNFLTKNQTIMMKKFFYLVFAAFSVMALSSCESNSDVNVDDASDDPMYEYYEPLIGEWSVYQYYGTMVDEYGVEDSFDFTYLLESGDIVMSFLFSDDMYMTQAYADSEGTTINNQGEVLFAIDVPNYFTVNYTNGKQFFEIVSVSETQLHLKVDEGSSVSEYVCRKK